MARYKRQLHECRTADCRVKAATISQLLGKFLYESRLEKG